MDYYSLILNNTIIKFNLIYINFNFGALFIVIFIIICLLALSFIISGAEVAFFSLESQDLKKIKNLNYGKKVIYLLSKPKELLSSLIIANTFINLFLILLINIQLNSFLHNFKINEFYLEIIKLLIEVFIIILFAEVLPKNFASQQNIRFALFSIPIVSVVFKLFFKFSSKLNRVSLFIENKISNNYDEIENNSNDELQHALEITDDKEENKSEIKLIKSIVDFNKKKVKHSMKSKIEIKAINFNLSFLQVKTQILDYQFSRIPIYKNDIDNIVGILNTKFLLPYLKEKSNFKWQELLQAPVFVLESQTLEMTLNHMKDKKVHLAIVIDEFGSTQGLITFEDIVEEVVGDIKDEFDTKENFIKTINKNTFIFDAKISLQDFSNYLKIPIENFENIKKESNSLAGLLLELFGEMPKIKSNIIWNNLKFSIIKIKNNRIIDVKVRVLKQKLEISNTNFN